MGSVKETMDVVKSLNAVAAFIEAAKADGAFKLDDLFHALPFTQAFKDAFDGIEKVPDEVKNLSGANVEELVVALSHALRHLFEVIVK